MFNQLCVSKKIFLPSLISVFCLMVVCVVSAFVLLNVQTKSRSLLEAEVPNLIAVRDIEARAYEAAYRVMTATIVSQVENDQKVVTQVLDHAKGTQQQFLQSLAAIDKESTIGQSLVAIGQQYVEESAEVLDMAVVDASTALIMNAEVEKLFAQIEDKIKIYSLRVSEGLDAGIADAEQNGKTGLTVQSAVAIGSVVLAILATLALARNIVTAIRKLTTVMKRLAEGKLDIALEQEDRGDEIGDMARTLVVFKENAQAKQEMELRAAEERAAGEERQKALENATREFELGSAKTVETVDSSSNIVFRMTDEMLQRVERVNGRTMAATNSVQTMSEHVQSAAVSTQQLSGSIDEINRQVDRSAEKAEIAVQQAKNAEEKVGELSSAADRIGEIIGLIADIAEQTNLLALNATIESARAGDAGKGFAVVASEVKSLAQQTSKATEDISNQIGSIQGATRGTVEAIDGIANVINELNEISTVVASAVTEQAAASDDIAKRVEMAADNAKGAVNEVAGVEEEVKETGQAASQMSNSLKSLRGTLGEMSELIDGFLQNTRV